MSKHLLKIAFVFILLFLGAHTASASVGVYKPMNNLGLVGWWTMDETRGTISHDKSGNGNNGTLMNGAGWGPGKRGLSAATFDDTNDYISVGDKPILNLSSAGTVAAWVKLPAGHTGYDTAVAKLNFVTDDDGYDLYTNGSTFGFEIFEGAGYTYTESGSGINDGNWHFILGTFDGANLVIYQDGVQVSTIAQTVGGPTPTGRSLQIGGDPTPGNAYATSFAGSIDEVRIYNRALSAVEVKGLYDSKSITFNKPTIDTINNGLVAHWSLDGKDTDWSTGRTIDSAGGNTGVVQGMSTTTSPTIGKLGQGMNFDGLNDRILTGVVNLPGAMTECAWAKWNNGAIADSELISNKDAASHLQYNLEVYFNPGDVVDGGKIHLFSSGTVEGFTNFETTGNLINKANRWYHICVSRIDDFNAVAYLDGVQYAMTQPSVGAIPATSDPVVIGSGGLSGDDWHNGAIDDVRLYNRVLSPAEIKLIYASGQSTVGKTDTDRLTDGLVGYWSFNGKDTDWTSSTAGSALDRSGQANTGTLVSMKQNSSPVLGKIGQALKFDGTSEIQTTNSYSNPQVYTVSIWFKTTDASGAKLIGFEDVQSGTAVNYDRHLWMGTDGKIYFGWYSGSLRTVASLSTLNDGKWHHAVGTHTGSIGILYIDGVAQGSDIAGSQSYTGWWRIGGFQLNSWPSSVATGYFKGFLDEARVYHKALSATEVKQLYKLGN